MKSIILIGFLRLISLLPLAMARRLGQCCGKLNWLFNSRMARIARINLSLCLPDLNEKERRQLAKRSVEEICVTIMETGAVWLWPAEKILGSIKRVRGGEILNEAYGRGRGVVVISPHLGLWELMGLYLNTCGVGQTYQMYQAPKDAGLGRLILEARSRSGARMVETSNKGVAKVLSALRKGEVVGILPDQVPPPEGGEFAPFFGVPALTMTLVSRLLAKTGAALVLANARRLDEEGGFEIIFQQPERDVYHEDLKTSLAAMNRSMENQIKECPQQYQWAYKRFKRQPPGMDRPY